MALEAAHDIFPDCSCSGSCGGVYLLSDSHLLLPTEQQKHLWPGELAVECGAQWANTKSYEGRENKYAEIKKERLADVVLQINANDPHKDRGKQSVIQMCGGSDPLGYSWQRSCVSSREERGIIHPYMNAPDSLWMSGDQHKTHCLLHPSTVTYPKRRWQLKGYTWANKSRGHKDAMMWIHWYLTKTKSLHTSATQCLRKCSSQTGIFVRSVRG